MSKKLCEQCKTKPQRAKGLCESCYKKTPKHKRWAKEYWKQYQKEHREELNAYHKNYRKKNIERVRLNEKNSRLKKKNTGFYTEKLYDKAKETLSEDVAMAFVYNGVLLDDELKKKGIGKNPGELV